MKHLILILPLLAACTPVPGTTPIPAPGGPDTCGAADYADLVGLSLAATTLPVGLNMRVTQPGDMVTMDFAPDRLNIRVDEAGLITSVTCG
ncbi:Peptidase inhibitor I78 family protein [Loktanella fryxellensis]|uniref:Peptidase inhibitor I78 family protein n=1 Tax=Loktanella fryxellensis TaxID=245187 RepID=A0A1H8FKS0_9RHOB|nr:I78 family peptidase inhibitor [Loktanella fryxellensis]SEN31767.1 Peptidase inhibitor I78 family protein [Loktanella fryxellensis]